MNGNTNSAYVRVAAWKRSGVTIKLTVINPELVLERFSLLL